MMSTAAVWPACAGQRRVSGSARQRLGSGGLPGRVCSLLVPFTSGVLLRSTAEGSPSSSRLSQAAAWPCLLSLQV